jgi:putative glutamine amidotransferase
MDVQAVTPAYVDAVTAAGGAPLLIPLGLAEDILSSLLDLVDGLVLTGGGDIAGDQYHSEHTEYILDVDDDRDRTEIFLAREALSRHKPLLGICRGHQLLNVALGGTLYEDVLSLMPGAIKHEYYNVMPREYLAHTVAITAGSRLATTTGLTHAQVNSLHHQGIRDLAPRLKAVAHAPDGLIEGVEVMDYPFAIGVQWHPENLYPTDPAMLALFRGLVSEAEGAQLAHAH